MLKGMSAANLLIVSNSSGLRSKDLYGSKAAQLEQNTGIPVLRHHHPKPACGPEILTYFEGRIDDPSQILFIGDRLFTDVIMANRMGAWSLWIKRGVIPDNGIITRVEYSISSFLLRHGFEAPTISS